MLGIERIRGARDSSGELVAGKIGDAERGFLADAHGIGVGLRKAQVGAHAVRLGDAIKQGVAFVDEHAVIDVAHGDRRRRTGRAR